MTIKGLNEAVLSRLNQNVFNNYVRQNKVLSQLATGKAIQTAADDVAALAIGTRLVAERSALQSAQQNATQAASLLQIGEGTLQQTDGILNRLNQLAVQAGSGNLGDSERAALNVEFQSLAQELDRLSSDTTFNGQALFSAQQSVSLTDAVTGLDGASVVGVEQDTVSTDNISFDSSTNEFTVTINGTAYKGEVNISDIGADGTIAGAATVRLTSDSADGQVVLNLGDDFDTSADIADAGTLQVSGESSVQSYNFTVGDSQGINVDLVGINTTTLGLTGLSLGTIADAEAAAAAVQAAQVTVAETRADIGAAQNRLSSAQETLAVAEENTKAAASSFLDADIAKAASDQASSALLLQASVGVAAQGNFSQNYVLGLLGN